MPPHPDRKLLIVGWDAADWKIIDPLLARGAMPNLKRVIGAGLRADLATLEPKLSPILWTTVATGKTADKHGVLNFVEPEPSGAGLRPVCSTSRRTKALWNILSQAGLRTDVVSWYATHPAEPIRGVVVSNLFQEGLPSDPAAVWALTPGCVHPASVSERIADLRLHPRELTGADLAPLLPSLRSMDPADRRIGLLARQVAQCASVHNVATSLLEDRGTWDCAMVFYEAIDVAGHHFMQYHPPRMAHIPEREFELFRHVVPGVYALQDAMLGRLLELAGDRTTLILLSDHGFHSDHLRPPVPPAHDDAHAAMDASWHRATGVLVMSGPGVRAGAPVYGANLLDIAPTALALLGLPAGADMDGRVLVEGLEESPPERVFTWDSLDGSAGMHPDGARADPFEAADTMRQLADLGYIEGAGAQAGEMLELCRLETRFNLGAVYLSTRRPREAAAIFEDLHRERPQEPRYAMMLAHSWYALGRYSEMRALLEPWVRAHPRQPDPLMLLAGALFGSGRYEEAGALLESAERDFPDGPELLCMLGEAYTHLRRFDDSARALARSAALDPHAPGVHVALARLEMNRGNLEPAAEHCLRALELRHFFPEAHYLLGTILTWMKEYDHAIRAFDVALSMQPGMIDAHRFLASIYRHQARAMDAARHRQIAQRLRDDHAAGRPSLEHSVREAPLGPQEWARQFGVPDDTRPE